MLTEETRYIGSDGKPINLAQTEGHLKLDLTRIRKTAEPRPIDGFALLMQSGAGGSTGVVEVKLQFCGFVMVVWRLQSMG